MADYKSFTIQVPHGIATRNVKATAFFASQKFDIIKRVMVLRGGIKKRPTGVNPVEEPPNQSGGGGHEGTFL